MQIDDEFREAVKSVLNEWLEEQRAVAAKAAEEAAAAEQAEVERVAREAEEADAAAVAEAERWHGHTHRWPKSPTDGLFVCRDCGHAEPASKEAGVKLQADEVHEPVAGAEPSGPVPSILSKD